ncbi:MAG: PilZ domain-containing protein [Polyangiales bacterium]
MTEESRRNDRVTLNKEFDSFDSFVNEYVTNVSRSGAFIRSKAPLPVGTLVNLRFSVVVDEIETIEGVGEVVRVQDDPRWAWYSRNSVNIPSSCCKSVHASGASIRALLRTSWSTIARRLTRDGEVFLLQKRHDDFGTLFDVVAATMIENANHRVSRLCAS